MKIIGKYEIIEEKGKNIFLTQSLNQQYTIMRYSKKDKSELENTLISKKASEINSLSHKNLKHFLVEEDSEYFYSIQENIDDNTLCDFSSKSQSYELSCYLQIHSALQYIHDKGFCHGAINPTNICVNATSEVFLLDFGKSYFTDLLLSHDFKNSLYVSPEQIAGGA